MEFAAAALASVAEIGTAVAGTAGAFGAPGIPSLFSAAGVSAAAGATGSALLSAAGSASTWSTILAGGATVASVLATQRAGEDKAFALTAQADDAELSSRVEQVQGLDRRNSLKAALVQAVGDRDVAAAASGVDLSFGTPSIARGQAIKDGERAITVDQDTEDFRRSRLLERAGNYRLAANNARSGALASSAALALEGSARLLKRG